MKGAKFDWEKYLIIELLCWLTCCLIVLLTTTDDDVVALLNNINDSSSDEGVRREESDFTGENDILLSDHPATTHLHTLMIISHHNKSK